MRRFLPLLATILVPLVAAPPCRVAAAEPFVLSVAGSERATTGPGNNIVTHDGRTHVVWQDCEPQGYVNRVRTLDRASGKWSDAVTLGPGVDNHARPTIAVDAQGYLHVVLGGHNTMMYYLRSVKPNDAAEWTKRQPIDDGTYPMLVCDRAGGLVLAARPKTHGGVNLYLRPAGESKWTTRAGVLKRNKKYSGYAGYNVALAFGPDGALHFAADVYEGRGYDKNRGTHQAIVYLRSRDFGRTWTKADGATLPEQIDPTEMDVLARIDVGVTGPAQQPRLRNGGVVVDAQNRPLVYFTEKPDDGPGTARLVRYEAGAWRDLPLMPTFQAQWPDAEALGARGHLSIAPDDALTVLVEYSPIPPQGKTFARFTRPLAMGLLTSRDAGQTFTARELLPLDAAHHYTQASLERQTGANDLRDRAPAVIVTDGEQRYPAKGEVIQNRVLFLEP
jgi:hypothetical protein